MFSSIELDSIPGSHEFMMTGSIRIEPLQNYLDIFFVVTGYYYEGQLNIFKVKQLFKENAGNSVGKHFRRAALFTNLAKHPYNSFCF
jgi:hypothetical protein